MSTPLCVRDKSGADRRHGCIPMQWAAGAGYEMVLWQEATTVSRLSLGVDGWFTGAVIVTFH